MILHRIDENCVIEVANILYTLQASNNAVIILRSCLLLRYYDTNVVMLDDGAWRCYNVTFNKLDLLLGEAQLCLPCVRLLIRK